MAGGIQRGTEAGSEQSKRLDGDVKLVAEALAQSQSRYFFEYGHRSLDETKNFSEKTIWEAALPEMRERGIRLGCIPDGGMWFDAPRHQPRSLKVVFEAKHQQDGGNAIERWAKNYLLCTKLWPGCRYVTFMTGEGAKVGGVLHDFGETMTAINGPDCIFYYAPEGFTKEGIFNIMNSILDLDMTFEQIRSNLWKKPNIMFDRLFETQTEEQRQQRLAEAEARFKVEQQFSRFAQDPEDPIYPVWHRINKSDKTEAQEIAIGMIEQGMANSVIATELVECFINR